MLSWIEVGILGVHAATWTMSGAGEAGPGTSSPLLLCELVAKRSRIGVETKVMTSRLVVGMVRPAK